MMVQNSDSRTKKPKKKVNPRLSMMLKWVVKRMAKKRKAMPKMVKRLISLPVLKRKWTL